MHDGQSHHSMELQMAAAGQVALHRVANAPAPANPQEHAARASSGTGRALWQGSGMERAGQVAAVQAAPRFDRGSLPVSMSTAMQIQVQVQAGRGPAPPTVADPWVGPRSEEAGRGNAVPATGARIAQVLERAGTLPVS